MTIRINPVSLEELAVIRELSQQIWPVAYGAILSGAQIDYMLDQMYSLSSLTKQVQAGHYFLLASNESGAIGYASGSLESEKIIKLQKLYVHQNSQRRGIGCSLLKEMISYGLSKACSVMELNVNRYNQAILFYQVQGFKIKEAVDISIGNGFFMNDYIMSKTLT
jgi:ribosomal protein S18 acetylase RimI-like enzyme